MTPGERAVAGGAVVPLPGRPFHCHAGTSNASFLAQSEGLRARGVRNHRFMLALYDPELHGVDPLSEGLRPVEQGRVLQEVVQNPWYFMREVVRIPVPGGTSRFELHRGNMFLLWCMVANLNFFLVLPRQTYKTVSVCSFFLWYYTFGATNSHALFFNKEHIDSKNNLKRLKDIGLELPAWMQEATVDRQRDTINIESVVSHARGNKIDAKPAGKDAAHADKLGRGATVPSAWYDEIAFMKYAGVTYEAAAPSGGAAKELAARNGSPYCTAVTTTPNNLDLPEAEFAYKIKTGGLQFRDEFYDMGPARVRALVDREAELPFVCAQYTWRELGKTEAWYRSQCRELLNNTVKVRRELDLVWPLSGEGSVFEEEQLEALAALRRPYVGSMPVRPPGGGAPPDLCILWTEQPDARARYVVGVDMASGEGGGDYSALVFHRPSDMAAVGVLRTRTSDTEAMRHVLRHVFVGLFPCSVAVFERNYLGLAMINFLVKEVGIEGRLFYTEKVRSAQRVVGGDARREAAGLRRRVREYGVLTDAGSREQMVRHLFQIVGELPHLFPLPAIQDEVRTLQRKKNGKVEHRAGFHDDVLFASLVCHFADRHDGGVLRQILSRAGGSRDAAAGEISAMNLREPSLGAGAAAMPPPTLEEELAARFGGLERVRTVDVGAMAKREGAGAADPAARRRREVADLIASLNGAPGREPPL